MLPLKEEGRARPYVIKDLCADSKMLISHIVAYAVGLTEVQSALCPPPVLPSDVR